MVHGAVQMPPSGEPIVLLCDHATMGGYPVVATVISADLGALAQRRPGDSVQFEIVDLDQALEARAALDRQLARAASGLYPTGEVSSRGRPSNSAQPASRRAAAAKPDENDQDPQGPVREPCARTWRRHSRRPGLSLRGGPRTPTPRGRQSRRRPLRSC